jgi:hypothetical protein
MKQKSTKGGRTMKKSDYTTIRVNKQSAKQLERIAAILTIRDEKPVDKSQAFEIAVNIANAELTKALKQ